MRIAHISDVHIRLKERHTEYREVFNRLYGSLREQKPDRILLAGDIVHSKITLSPELVGMVQEFFMRLQEIAPLDLVIGNHDMNLSNMDRMDALSPIVDMVKDHAHGLTYYTNTGLHEVSDDIVYGVYSLLDGGDIQLRKKDKEDGKSYIAIFHGSVSGCKLDNDYVFSDSTTSLNTFNNFDYVMLGDIHRRQFLNDTNTAAYPGSLIQQNHGEDLEKGYLMWDIRGRNDFDVEFVRVYNDYAYYTIFGDDERGLPDLDLPSKTRIRVIWMMKAKDISRAKASLLNSEIREKYNPLSVQLTFKPIGSTGIGEVDVDHSSNLANPDVQADLLKQWFENLDEDVDVDSLMRIDKKIEELVVSNDYEDFNNSHWHLKHLTMENFMSYTEPMEVDFDAMRGVIGLFGDNTVGKSVIIDAVLYALFNKTTRDVKNEDLVNKMSGSDSCRVKLVLEIKEVEYEIDRWTTRQFQKRTGRFINARTDVTLKRRYNDTDEWENLTETTRNDSEKIIRNAIGSFDDFMITTLSTQGGSSEFLRLRPSPRADTMLRFLGLDVFNRKYEYANDLLKEIEASRRGLDQSHEIELLDTKKTKLKGLTTEIADLRKKVKGLDDTIEQLRETIVAHKASINTTIKIDKDVDTLMAEKKKTLIDIAELEKQKSEVEGKISVIMAKVDDLETTYVLSEAEYLRYSNDARHGDALKKQIAESQAEIESNKKLLRIYRPEIVNGNACPVSDDPRNVTCVYLKGYIEKKRAAEALIEDIQTIQSEIRDCEAEYIQVEMSYGILEEQEKIRDHITKAVAKASEFTKKLTEIEGKLEVKNISLNLVNNQLSIANKNEETIKNNKRAKAEVERLQVELDLTIGDREGVNNQREKREQSALLLKKEISDIEETLEKIRKSDIEYNLYNLYCNAMHRKGLPVDVLKGYIPKINYEINKILSDVVDFGVYLKIEEGETDIDIVMRYDGNSDDTRPASMASGMEKLLINMALRYALLSVSNLNTPSTWFIDEGFGVLDAENLFSMARFFDNVRGVFRNVVIITHIDTLKDVANWVINIEKKDGISLANVPVKNI